MSDTIAPNPWRVDPQTGALVFEELNLLADPPSAITWASGGQRYAAITGAIAGLTLEAAGQVDVNGDQVILTAGDTNLVTDETTGIVHTAGAHTRTALRADGASDYVRAPSLGAYRLHGPYETAFLSIPPGDRQQVDLAIAGVKAGAVVFGGMEIYAPNPGEIFRVTWTYRWTADGALTLYFDNTQAAGPGFSNGTFHFVILERS